MHGLKVVFASLLFFVFEAAFSVQAKDTQLQGCWRSVTGTSHLADGSSRELQSKCTTEFTKERIVSRCISQSGRSSIEYRYKILGVGLYEAQIVTHTLAAAVGSSRTYEYKIENDLLYITTYPQTTKPAPLNAVVKFVSKSVREPKSCSPE
jgi:hypothetical protein